MYTHMHANTNKDAYICIIHTCIPNYLPTYIYTNTHTYTHIYIQTYIHTCMHACMHTVRKTSALKRLSFDNPVTTL